MSSTDIKSALNHVTQDSVSLTKSDPIDRRM